MRVIEGYYLPPRLRGLCKEVRAQVYNGITLHLPVVTKGLVQEVVKGLREARERYLARLPISHIVGVLDEASRWWLKEDYPLRQEALAVIPAITGLSRAVVKASIDAEMESSLSEDIWQALHSELGNPHYLDGFQYCSELAGHRRAYGPGLLIAIFSGNIPALPHLLFMRSALVKAACLGKMAAGEPAFTPLYLRTIEAIDPQMAEAMAALYWPGGEAEIEEALFKEADAVVIFGGVEACQGILARVPRDKKIICHSHRIGFGFIGRGALRKEAIPRLAEGVAYDHAMFDQHACLAPQAYFVEEGGEVTPQVFAQAVAEAMGVWEERMPRGRISRGEAAAIHQLRARYELGGERMLFTPNKGTAWTVAYEEAPPSFTSSPLNRFVRIWGVKEIFASLPLIRPLVPFLQNAAVAIGDEREGEFIARLGELGVSRVTSPGQMPLPSMMWRHDGIATLASLLRWCDVEKKEL